MCFLSTFTEFSNHTSYYMVAKLPATPRVLQRAFLLGPRATSPLHLLTWLARVFFLLPLIGIDVL